MCQTLKQSTRVNPESERGQSVHGKTFGAWAKSAAKAISRDGVNPDENDGAEDEGRDEPNELMVFSDAVVVVSSGFPTDLNTWGTACIPQLNRTKCPRSISGLTPRKPLAHHTLHHSSRNTVPEAGYVPTCSASRRMSEMKLSATVRILRF